MKGTLSFGADGENWGVAFTSDSLKKGPIYAAIALLHCAGCRLISSKPVPEQFLEWKVYRRKSDNNFYIKNIGNL